jgi:thioredoxin reductase (NADPH)
VALVGAGDSACEEASYLAKLCPKVYMLVRRDEFRASKAMVHRVENTPNIEILYNTEVKDVLGDKSVEGLIVTNNKTGEEQKLDVTGLFLAIGHTPNTAIFKGWLDMDDVGYLKHNPDRTTTKIPGVFVAGDAADHVYRQAVTAAGTGCMAALDAERYLAARGH